MIIKKWLLLLSLTSSLSLIADWPEEHSKIQFLIEQVSKVDGQFERNGKKHSPQEAADHLQLKLRNSLNSWFTPRKEKWTATLFIEKVASQSTISGKLYWIHLNQGGKVKAKDWLKQQLKNYRKK